MKIQAFIDSPDPYVAECWSKCTELVGKSSAKFIYEDYDVQDFDSRVPEKTYYAYVYRKGLIRKNYLANRISYYVAKNPNSVLKKSFPESYNLEVDYAEFLDDSLDEAFELRQAIDNDSKTWIIKPAMADRATGIFIFRTIDALQETLDDYAGEDGELPFRHFVVQEYMDRPLLVDSRKFHIRTYILCVGALKVYVYDEMLALFSGEEYRLIDSDRVEDLSPHLTNTCAQKKEAFDSNIVKLLSSLDVGADVKTRIVDGIHEITHDLFDAQVADPVNFQPLPNAIEFFGLDFLVRDNGAPVLLEANAYPDFAQTGDLKALVEGLFEETAKVLSGETEGNGKLALVYNRSIR